MTSAKHSIFAGGKGQKDPLSITPETVAEGKKAGVRFTDSMSAGSEQPGRTGNVQPLSQA